jgi:hypothetical protein
MGVAAQDDGGGTSVDHWSKDPLLQRRVLLGTLITLVVLAWSVPTPVLVVMAMVLWPLGVLEASSAMRQRRAASMAHAAA